MSKRELLHFVQTADFADCAADVPLSAAELRELENMLLDDPEAGAEIPGTGGVRKIRLGVKGRGRSTTPFMSGAHHGTQDKGGGREGEGLV